MTRLISNHKKMQDKGTQLVKERENKYPKDGIFVFSFGLKKEEEQENCHQVEQIDSSTDGDNTQTQNHIVLSSGNSIFLSW